RKCLSFFQAPLHPKPHRRSTAASQGRAKRVVPTHRHIQLSETRRRRNPPRRMQPRLCRSPQSRLSHKASFSPATLIPCTGKSSTSSARRVPSATSTSSAVLVFSPTRRQSKELKCSPGKCCHDWSKVELRSIKSHDRPHRFNSRVAWSKKGPPESGPIG